MPEQFNRVRLQIRHGHRMPHTVGYLLALPGPHSIIAQNPITSHHSTQFDNFQSPHNAHHYFFFGYFSYIIVIMIYKHIHVFFHFLFFFFKFRYSVLLTLTSNFIQKIGVRFQKCPISINFKIGTCCLISLL